MTSAGGLVGCDEADLLPPHCSSPARPAACGWCRDGAASATRRGDVRHGRHEHDRLPGAGRRSGAAPVRQVGVAVRLPALDIHTIGAGGGVDRPPSTGGALIVVPESAGADPGPACYGRVAPLRR